MSQNWTQIFVHQICSDPLTQPSENFAALFQSRPNRPIPLPTDQIRFQGAASKNDNDSSQSPETTAVLGDSNLSAAARFKEDVDVQDDTSDGQTTSKFEWGSFEGYFEYGKAQGWSDGKASGFGKTLTMKRTVLEK